jgi:hypothetical protein
MSNQVLLLSNAGDFGSGVLAIARSPRYLSGVRSRTPAR